MEGIHEADALCPAETATDSGQAPADGLAEPGRRVVEQRLYRALVDHAYGTARMGNDPDTSVLDKWQISHEVPNLLVLGGAAFPTTAGRNPTESIQATSWRAGDHLAKHFKSIAD